MTKFKTILSKFSLDFIGLCGFFMLFYGLFLWQEPLAWTVCGAVLMVLAIAGARNKPKHGANHDVS